MPNMQERLDAAVDKAEVDTGLLHNVVHGSITTEVTTEGGKVPSVAKVLNDMRVLMEADEAILYLIANGDSTKTAMYQARQKLFTTQRQRWMPMLKSSTI